MATETLERKPRQCPVITEQLEQDARDAGIRLEYVQGIPTWETFPVYRHQKKIDSIRASIRPTYLSGSPCECVSVPDLSILFPDGSVKRPDISLFCQEPDEEETICTQIPEVVIEIISKGYEKKDLEISLPFYLAQGIPDIVIFDPATNRITHYHQGRTDIYNSPQELIFACGCRATF